MATDKDKEKDKDKNKDAQPEKKAEKEEKKESKKEEKPSDDEKPSERKFKINFNFKMIMVLALIVINVGVILGAVGVIYYVKFVYIKPTIKEKTVKKEIKEKEENLVEFIEYKLDPFTVNLARSKLKKYVNARFTLIAVDWDTKDELDKKVDKIRDSIINILNEKNPDELITVQGKLFLKDQIVTAVNGVLVRGSVREAYIESFVIQ